MGKEKQSLPEKTMEEMAQKGGFDSLEEFKRLIESVDLTSEEKIKAFRDWYDDDGTKDGILKLEIKP